MAFNSAIFLFGFLPISVLGNLAIKEKYRNLWLVLCSLFFYAWTQPQFLWLLLTVVAVDYVSGILMERGKASKLILFLSVLGNLAGLLYFKYFDFLIGLVARFGHRNLQLLHLLLPMGISFYTFKGISYLADVYMKRTPAEKNLLNFTAYMVLFPQILSGPIDSYGKLAPALRDRKLSADQFSEGAKRFILGLSQKMLFANTLGVIVDDLWECGAGSLSWECAWLGSIAYSLQIYFDFAGYTGMAIGVGKMLGFEFSENFDYPYLSKSITEFWRRWHITLGEWFKKYVYIPLGGNRGSALRVYLNLGIVFLLTGIWHGAALTFIFWGLFHGFFRLLEKFLKDRKLRLPLPSPVISFLQHVYCLFVLNIGWVFFRAPGFQIALSYLKAMLGRMSLAPCGVSVWEYLDRWNGCILLLAILFATPLPKNLVRKLGQKLDPRVCIIAKDLFFLLLLLLSATEVVTGTYQTFIYFQF
ncbi:MAG: MBOAT family protein [Lachnospiraceae bacterium]|nr:MBOAT family protein [Lachnospiraceae bacterium]